MVTRRVLPALLLVLTMTGASPSGASFTDLMRRHYEKHQEVFVSPSSQNQRKKWMLKNLDNMIGNLEAVRYAVRKNAPVETFEQGLVDTAVWCAVLKEAR